MKTHIRTSIQVDEKYLGPEPTISHVESVKSIELLKYLNWCNYFFTTKEGKIWVLDYFAKNKQVLKSLKQLADHDFSISICSLARLKLRGTTFSPEVELYFTNKIRELEEKGKLLIKEDIVTKVVSVRDSINNQVTLLVSEIDGVIDEFIKTKKKVEFSMYDWLRKNDIKFPHAKIIQKEYNKMLAEVELAYSKKDEELKEGYSSYKRTELKTFVDLLSGIVNDCERFCSNRTITKKPKKKVTSTKKVEQIKYLKEIVEAKIKGLEPQKINGTSQLFFYNYSTQVLTKLVSQESTVFQLDKSSIANVDMNKSISKRVGRNKLGNLTDQLLSKSKRTINKIMDEIKTNPVDTKIRINENVCIIRTIK